MCKHALAYLEVSDSHCVELVSFGGTRILWCCGSVRLNYMFIRIGTICIESVSLIAYSVVVAYNMNGWIPMLLCLIVF